MKSTIAIVIATLLLWTSLVAFFYALKKRSTSSEGRKKILGYLLLYIGPMVLASMVFTLRLLVSPPQDYFLLGSNFMLLMFLFTGRYQYLSFIVRGTSYKAYSHFIEWLPGVLGIGLYVSLQLDGSAVPLTFPGLDREFVQATMTLYNLPALLWFFILLNIIELIFIFFQTNLLKEISWKVSWGRPLLAIHYITILSALARILLVVTFIMGNILVWRVSLLVVFIAQAMQLAVSLVAINTVLPQWAKGITPQGKIDIALWGRFMELLNSRKGYLSRHLKMQDISLDLGVQDRELRAAIGLNTENSFPTIITLFRLTHFIEHTKREDLRNHSLEQLAAQSGFNSRTSLHRACIKWTKMSASELINSERTIELTKFI